MGKTFLKDINAGRRYPRDSDIKNLLKYIAGKNGKKATVRYYNGKGLPKDPGLAAKRMIIIQKYFGKTDKRRVYHFVLSFPETVTDVIHVRLAAENVADFFYKTHQVYYGVHEDTDNLHVHFAVNAVSYVDGKKWHHSKNELKKIEEKIEGIIDELI